MSDTNFGSEKRPNTSGKILITISLLFSCIFGAGVFYIVQTLDFSGESIKFATMPHVAEPLNETAFLDLDPIIVSYETPDHRTHLSFRAQLEVPQGSIGTVDHLKPRVVDILNTFLRALRLEDIQQPSAFMALKAKMLRRVKLVVGEENIKNLLIMEFVLK